ncbi:helix-turn-helix transcriptional regulator (plasmid) [Vibrio harveyi]|uniref:S24 family peptidase n=3 Tax=Vibrio harveyi TaxID=669 RepID=UPI00165D66FB|nr:helix-turn-helix transcriptional regulator [Vibrio harveyi]HDM8071936.1 helix-turn-helix transcriptional regulator [Vibrio harveyi]
MEDISDRIKLKRLELRLNQRELAKKLRLTAPSVSQWERGVSEPKGNNLINLAKVFRTTPEWLLTGMEKNLDEPLCICVPLLENVLAAGGDGATNDDFTSISTVPVPSYVTKHRNINQIVSIQVMGDSMEPMLYDGGLVVIDKSEVSIRDGKVYVFRQDGMLRVKRLVLISGGVLIKSQNPAYNSETLQFKDCTDFQIIGRVIWTSSLL